MAFRSCKSQVSCAYSSVEFHTLLEFFCQESWVIRSLIQVIHALQIRSEPLRTRWKNGFSFPAKLGWTWCPSPVGHSYGCCKTIGHGKNYTGLRCGPESIQSWTSVQTFSVSAQCSSLMHGAYRQKQSFSPCWFLWQYPWITYLGQFQQGLSVPWMICWWAALAI